MLNPIFEPTLLQAIATHAQVLNYNEGDIIINIGQKIKAIPIVLSGVLKVSRIDDTGHEILLYYVQAKETCAMTFSCCMQENMSEVKAVAESDLSLLLIPIALMDQWMMQYPTWKSFIMKNFKYRFNELLKTIDQIAFQRLDERLIHFLKTKATVTNSSLINLSHEKIAMELASSREVISRLLKKLEMDKKVLLYRNQIKLLKEL